MKLTPPDLRPARQPACSPARWFQALAALVLVVGALAHADPLVDAAAPVSPETAAVPAEASSRAASLVMGKDWIIKAADNICGLKDASQLSNPAVVDYDALLAATPEMKSMRDQKIDANTPEGIRLTNAAVDRVTKACEEIRTQLGHCSVWKEVRHRDGRTLTDITSKVKAQF
ncbi:MAG: hypothetical protein HZA52_01955 [Planctomycetes bacterium]|nr:hypothetical protein [Planctomycetota bacterium]